MIQELIDVGLSDEKADELWRFGEDGHHAADMKRRPALGATSTRCSLLASAATYYKAEAKAKRVVSLTSGFRG